MRPFQFDTHVLHTVLSLLTFGAWAGVYWWRYQLARFRWLEEMLQQLAERQRGD